MRTTVNLPDDLLRQAKRKAIDEGRTLTDLLVEGLTGRIARGLPTRKLPVSTASGGLLRGVDWKELSPTDPSAEEHR